MTNYKGGLQFSYRFCFFATPTLVDLILTRNLIVKCSPFQIIVGQQKSSCQNLETHSTLKTEMVVVVEGMTGVSLLTQFTFIELHFVSLLLLNSL